MSPSPIVLVTLLALVPFLFESSLMCLTLTIRYCSMMTRVGTLVGFVLVHEHLCNAVLELEQVRVLV